LAGAAVHPYCTGGETIDIGKGLSGVLVSSPTALQTILDPLAWKNEDALRAFVQHPPHVRIMTAMTPHMGETKFVRWMVKGSQLPLNWDDALRRFANS